MPTFNEDVIVNGRVRVEANGDGATALVLDTERGWVFRQHGTGASTALELTAASASNNNKNFLINTDGRVGIGTVTPEAKLHVVGGPIRVSNTGDGAPLLQLDSERGWVFRQRNTGASTALELAPASSSNDNKHFLIVTDGNVGIGTRTPTAKLQVEGSIKSGYDVTAARRIGIGTETPQAELDVRGSIRVTGDVILAGADCAEDFEIDPASTVEPGTVMVIGPGRRLRHCSRSYDTMAAGIVSGAGHLRPGIVLGRHRSGTGRTVPLALTGTVYCNVDATSSTIEVGDLLTTSSTPGHAMKAGDASRSFGAVVGKALERLTAGLGQIPVLVALQ